MNCDIDDILHTALQNEPHLKAASEARFFRNVWLNESDVNSGRLDKYVRRLKAIGFEGFEHTLDVGCGFGQWSMALEQLNRHTDALDYNEGRVEVARHLADAFKINTIKFCQGDARHLPYADDFFDAVFCYGVLAGVHLDVVMAEFKRVLKSGGKLYAVVTGDNYFKYQIDHRSSLTGEDKTEMKQILANTQSKRALASYDLPVAISARELNQSAENLGFEIIKTGNEGSINLCGIDGNAAMIENPQGLDDYATEILCRK